MEKQQEEELQQKYMEFQMLGSQLKQLQGQLQTAEEQTVDLRTVMDGLSELKNTKSGGELLAPISEGIFVQGTVNNTSELIINVGADICVKKSVGDVSNLLCTRLDEIKAHRDNLVKQMETMAEMAGNLEVELTRLAQKNV
ncbi:MAG: prefoldin subunit alpha [bacterium]|nr:prefoldin subunit alpha [bacterium]